MNHIARLGCFVLLGIFTGCFSDQKPCQDGFELYFRLSPDSFQENLSKKAKYWVTVTEESDKVRCTISLPLQCGEEPSCEGGRAKLIFSDPCNSAEKQSLRGIRLDRNWKAEKVYVSIYSQDISTGSNRDDGFTDYLNLSGAFFKDESKQQATCSADVDLNWLVYGMVTR